MRAAPYPVEYHPLQIRIGSGRNTHFQMLTLRIGRSCTRNNTTIGKQLPSADARVRGQDFRALNPLLNLCVLIRPIHKVRIRSTGSGPRPTLISRGATPPDKGEPRIAPPATLNYLDSWCRHRAHLALMRVAATEDPSTTAGCKYAAGNPTCLEKTRANG